MKKSKREILPGDYISGFVDGEGCFALNFLRDIKNTRRNKPAYYYWRAQFAIVARDDDINLLRRIQNTLGCGKISFSRYAQGQTARYQVHDSELLYKVIIPFFKKYILYGKKRYDFKLWAEAVEIIYRNKREEINIQQGRRSFLKTEWDINDFKRLIKIRTLMDKYKSKRNKDLKWLEEAKRAIEGMVEKQGREYKFQWTT